MFQCCSQTPVLADTLWGCNVFSFVRFIGFSPLVLSSAGSLISSTDPYDGGTGNLYKSTHPLLETRYRTRVVYTEWNMYNTGTGLIELWWSRLEETYSLEMGDLIYWKESDSQNGTTLEYTLNNDGSSSTTGSAGSGIQVPSGAGYTNPSGYRLVVPSSSSVQDSRSATAVQWSRDGTVFLSGVGNKTGHWLKTITLSNTVEYATGGSNSRVDALATLLADASNIDVSTPGDDYTPTGATTWLIDGVDRILVPRPIEYTTSPDQDPYLEIKTTYKICHGYYRTGSGLAYLNKNGGEGVLLAKFPTNFNPSGLGTNYPTYGWAGRGATTVDVYSNTGNTSSGLGALTLLYVFNVRGKVLVSTPNGGFRYSNSGHNTTNSTIEDASSQAWAFDESVPFAITATAPRKVIDPGTSHPAVPPATSKSFFDDTAADWKPYYILLEDDLASYTTKTNALVVLGNGGV